MANYATIPEAQTYFNARLHTDAWDQATNSDRTKALSMATVIIDTLSYEGTKSVADQTNQFPRGGDTTIPTRVKDACAEIALALLDGVDPQLEAENLHLNSQGYGNIKTTYDTGVARPHIIAGVPSRTAWILLKPFLRDVNSIQLIRV